MPPGTAPSSLSPNPSTVSGSTDDSTTQSQSRWLRFDWRPIRKAMMAIRSLPSDPSSSNPAEEDTPQPNEPPTPLEPPIGDASGRPQPLWPEGIDLNLLLQGPLLDSTSEYYSTLYPANAFPNLFQPPLSLSTNPFLNPVGPFAPNPPLPYPWIFPAGPNPFLPHGLQPAGPNPFLPHGLQPAGPNPFLPYGPQLWPDPRLFLPETLPDNQSDRVDLEPSPAPPLEPPSRESSGSPIDFPAEALPIPLLWLALTESSFMDQVLNALDKPPSQRVVMVDGRRYHFGGPTELQQIIDLTTEASSHPARPPLHSTSANSSTPQLLTQRRLATHPSRPSGPNPFILYRPQRVPAPRLLSSRTPSSTPYRYEQRVPAPRLFQSDPVEPPSATQPAHSLGSNTDSVEVPKKKKRTQAERQPNDNAHRYSTNQAGRRRREGRETTAVTAPTATTGPRLLYSPTSMTDLQLRLRAYGHLDVPYPSMEVRPTRTIIAEPSEQNRPEEETVKENPFTGHWKREDPNDK